MRRRGYALVIGLSALSMSPRMPAADATVDDGLLEFLGSVDSDDKDWREYLADTDIDKVARRAPRPPSASSPPPSAPPSSTTPATTPVPGNSPPADRP